MKTITVRDLRQRWPQAEALLETEGEIIIVRGSQPVAKLVRLVEGRKARKRFDPAKHAAWQARVGGKRVVRWVDELLACERGAGDPRGTLAAVTRRPAGRSRSSGAGRRPPA